MPKRILQGTIVGDKGAKTVIVSVTRTFKHPVLQKTQKRSKRFHAHDETDQFKVGDLVQIQECAPKSKLKRWEVIGLGSKG